MEALSSVVVVLAIWFIGFTVFGSSPLFAERCSINYVVRRLRIWFHSLFVRLGRRKPKRFFKYSKEYMPKKPTLYSIGVLPSPNEIFCERRQDLRTQTERDGVVFWGVDWNQNEIVSRIVRKTDNVAEVWLLLRINGTLYQLPCDPDSRKCFIDPTNNKRFSAGGLNLECLRPMRRWRLSYNGLLKKMGSDNDDVHVKFSFIWHALSAIHDNLHDFENRDVASALESKEFKDLLKKVDMERFNKISDSYEQWGMLCGTVRVGGDADEKQLWMWGSRRRIMGHEEPMEERVRLDIYMKDGWKASLEIKNVPGLLAKYMNGHCHYQDYMEYLITSCQTDLLEMAKRGRFNSEFSLAFTSARSGRNHTIKMQPTSECISLQGINQHTLLYPMTVRLADKEGRALLQYSFGDLDTSNRKGIHPPLLLMDKVNADFPLSVAYDDTLCQSSRLVGGKGLSLGLLTALTSARDQRFKVPKFTILTTEAYEQHVGSNSDIQKAICSLRDALCQNERKEVDDACKRVQLAFEETELENVTSQSLVGTLKQTFGDEFQEKSFAVRSSACGEDSEELSAAGQMSTMLGVKGLPSLCKAVLACWASHFKYECIQYERQNGQPITSPMAVVIQEMIDAETAGVFFSVHPVTNDPKFMCITANYGLGESVVSASSEPDTITLKRRHEGKTMVEIHEIEIGSKTSQVVLKDNRVEEIAVDSSEVSRCSLSTEMALKLGEIGLLVEECFCSPRDIEWAIKDGDLYLLQARPITTLDALTDFEVTHDQDAAAPTDGEYWTIANVAEVFPKPLSPLNISTASEIIDKNIMFNTNKIDGISVTQPIVYNKMCFPFSHRRIFINVIDLMYKRTDKVITTSQMAFEVGIFGRALNSVDIHEMAIQRNGCMSKLSIVTRLISIITEVATGYTPQLIKNTENVLGGFVIATSKCETAADMYQLITEKLEVMREVNFCHTEVSSESAIMNVFLLTLLGQNKKEWDVELYTDFASLMSCNDVESANVPEAIEELCDCIREDNRCDFSAMSTEDAIRWLQQHEGKVGQKYAAFLEKHGHRGIQEFDMASKPWRMDPQNLAEALQASVANGAHNSKRKSVCSVEESIKTIKTPLGYFAKFFLSKLLPRCRKLVGRREQSKSHAIKAMDIFRSAYLDLGRQMVKEGRLPSQDLIFFLEHEEIGELIETRSPTLLTRAIKRQKIQTKLETVEFSEIVHGIPKSETEDKAHEIIKGATVSLKGTPVSNGITTARARVILKLEEAKSIQSGEILICRATDIGWSPYFPMLAGVVTELGGLISHGAVVAREYGIPCIVGVKRATSVFKTGDLLIMDATKGILVKIDQQQVSNGQT